MRRGRGFTLLEVLVALAIFAVVAASVLSASARSLKTAARLEDKTFATWLADNRLQEIQPVHIRYPHIRHHQVDAAGRQPRKRRRPIRCLIRNLEAIPAPGKPPEPIARTAVAIQNQNLVHSHSPLQTQKERHSHPGI